MANALQEKSITSGIIRGHIPLQEKLNILHSIALPFWVFDIDRCRVYWANAAGLDIWNAASLDELSSRDMSKDMSVTVKRRLNQYQKDFARGASFTEFWTLYPRGEPKTLKCIFAGIELDDGRMAMFNQAVGQADQQESPEKLRSIGALLHTSVMISLYDKMGKLLYSNPAARHMHATLDLSLRDRFIEPEDYQTIAKKLGERGEVQRVIQVRTLKGPRWHEIDARWSWDPATGEPTYLFSEIDVTVREDASRQVSFLALHDILTKLPNRRLLERNIDAKFQEAIERRSKLGLMFIDIDRFKNINDSLGHAAGDRLLVCVANRLLSSIRNVDLLARLGGDEFVLIISEVENSLRLREIAEQISKELSKPITIDGQDINVTVSIGISIFPDHGSDLDGLMRHADLAMYAAKESGRNQSRFFVPALKDRMKLRLELEASVRDHHYAERFQILYQPRLRVADDTVVGVEALLRWKHPSRGTLMPGEFIGLAEETGLIEPLGMWVLAEGVKQQHYWRTKGLDVTVAVNVSPCQFHSDAFIEAIERLAGESWCDPGLIELEITETALMGDCNDIRNSLQRLRDLGFGLALDDFGTGYSNLAYLRDYPITSLKIDRSFMRDLRPGAIVEGIIAMCRFLDVKIVAEGVEQKHQLDWLRERACDEYQGFYFSTPVKADKVTGLLEGSGSSAI